MNVTNEIALFISHLDDSESGNIGPREGKSGYVGLAETILETCRDDYIYCLKLVKEYGDVLFIKTCCSYDKFSVIKEVKNDYLAGYCASDHIRIIENYIRNHPMLKNPESIIKHLKGEVA